MRRLITSLVVAATLATTGLAAQDSDLSMRSPEHWQGGSDRDGVAIEPAQDLTAPERQPDASQEQLEQEQQGSGVAKAIAIGAAIGAAVFVGFLVFIATAMN